MKTYDYFLFDLDGTISDPKEGITKSAAYALNQFGITAEQLDDLYCFIGPPLTDSFRKFYGFTETQAKEAVLKYREYFQDRGIYENKLYEGIKELFQAVRKQFRSDPFNQGRGDFLYPYLIFYSKGTCGDDWRSQA